MKKGYITTLLMIGLIVSCGGNGGGSDNTAEAIPTPPPETTQPTNSPPVIDSFTVDKTTGTVPLTVNFGWSVKDPDGDALTCYLDADNNGIYEYTGLCNVSSYPSYTYNNAGTYTAVLKVSDGEYEVTEVLTIKVEQLESSQPSPPTTQTYYEINIINPNAYRLTDYQVRITITKAVSGDKVFDFYDDFSVDNLDNYNVLEFMNGNAYVSNGFLYLSLPSSSLGDTVSIYFPLSQPITTGIVEAKIYEGLFNDTYARQFSIGFSATNNVLIHWYTSTISGDHFYNYLYFANSTKCGLETVYDPSQTIVASTCGIVPGRRTYLLSFKMNGNQGYSFYKDDNSVELSNFRTSTVNQLQKNYAFISYHKYYLRPRSIAQIDWIRVRKYADQEPIVTVNADTITILNPNTYNLRNFQVKLPITQPIYDLVDSRNGHSVLFCFEHSNGECDNRPFDIKAVWVKIPSIPAKSSVTLTIKYQPFFSNIKILDSDGNPVPYCFEQTNGECNTNPTRVMWVKVPSIPANGMATLKVVEDSVNNAVNGDKVFDFYDDFSGTALDTTKWITTSDAIYSISNGVLYLGRGGINEIHFYSAQTFNTPYIVETRHQPKLRNDGSISDGGVFFNVQNNANGYLVAIRADVAIGSTQFYKRVGGTWTSIIYDTSDVWIENVWQIVKVEVLSGTFKIYKDGSFILSAFDTTFNNGAVGLRGDRNLDGTINYQLYDWIRVRKYADQEPTYVIRKITP